MQAIWSIFNPGEAHTSKGVSYGPSATPGGDQPVLKCLFCDVMTGAESGTIVYENEDLSVFRNIRPYTANHLLVTPRKHIKSIHELSGEDHAQLVESLVAAGRTALNSLKEGSGDSALMCFHVPPFNSVDHLHLHAIGDPDTLSVVGSMKYAPGNVYCRSAEETCQNLRRKSKL